LRSATLAGKSDSLDSPSARIVVGKPCFGGTGNSRTVNPLGLHTLSLTMNRGWSQDSSGANPMTLSYHASN
jgi:hypothetical protein